VFEYLYFLEIYIFINSSRSSKNKKMPRISKHLNANSKVKVSARFLRQTDAPERLTGRYDFNAPGLSFEGHTIAQSTNDEQRVVFDVVLDELPDVVYTLLGNSLKYVGPVEGGTASEEPETVPEEAETDQADIGDPHDEADTILDDAEKEEDERDLVDRSEGDERSGDGAVWRQRQVFIDSRSAHGYDRAARIDLVHPEYAAPLDYFLRFLPVRHIQDTVIPCINDHARAVTANWQELTWLEYLTWMGLMLHMMIWQNDDVKAYWRMADISSFMSVDFAQHMTYQRYKQIIEIHVFKVPDGAE
jgi:hypothetical protein